MNKATAIEAYRRLFKEQPEIDFRTRFSLKFKPYNANVRKRGKTLIFSFSPEWRSINREITIGLIQELTLRILAKKAPKTTNISLYNNFIRSLDLAAGKKESDPFLLEIFNRVNREHFNGLIETPCLKWGINSSTTLANYNYHTDTINVSRLFRDAGEELIAYLLHHEMIHKKLKFSTSASSGRSVHHSAEFRRLEKKFPDRDLMEKRIRQHLRGKRRKKRFLFF